MCGVDISRSCETCSLKFSSCFPTLSKDLFLWLGHMSENVMISKMENNTKQTLTKDDRFSLYVYLDHFVHQFLFFFFCLFIWLCWVSVVAHWISDLRWCMWDLCSTGDLVPWPGIEPGSPALGAWSLGHWTTREVLSPSGLNHINFSHFVKLGSFFCSN